MAFPKKLMSKPRRTPRQDGKATRAKIMEIAGRLFAERGYAGTASKEICEQAGTDLAAINYHFGSRDGLYAAVLAEGHKHFIDLETLKQLAESSLPAREKLEVFIDTLVANLSSDKSGYIRVCAREILAPTQHFGTLINNEVMPKFKLVRGILGDITGLASDDPALVRCAVSIVAPCLMLMVVDRNINSPPQQLLNHSAADLASHLKRFSLAGLDAIAGEFLG